MTQPNTYQNYKLAVKAVAPGSLSTFLYAYCKTQNCPDNMEQAFIRKAISFAKLARYVRTHITNDFDGWYRANEDSEALCQVMAAIINTEDDRTEIYKPAPAKQLVSNSFTLAGIPFEMVLVSRH